MSTFRLILWPTLITALVCTARLVAEVQGWVAPQSGGALHPLGISWLAFASGGYFAWCLSRNGSTPIRRPAWPWFVGAFLLVTASVAWQFRPFFDADQSDATFQSLRIAVLTLAGIATTLALVLATVWPRLVVTLLCYAIPTRALVLGFTWLAKHNDWTTHYTRFGPPGIEVDMGTTMISAAIAQGGFWIPWTIIASCLTASLFTRRR